MTAPIDRLSAALADRYVIEREIGEGGMATVYLAQDVRHDRKVLGGGTPERSPAEVIALTAHN